jgi:pyruvate/2-oxoglutarate/acetoin dehydrogenase E1 component
LLNVGNCENTHVGTGLGMLIRGGRAALFVKQLDFLLLAADQMTNTWNLVRAAPPANLGSFTIIVIVCDQGMQGPQSSCQSLADLCSLARLDGYTLTDAGSADDILHSQLGAPGFRIIALSQRLFSGELADVPVEWSSGDGRVFQYQRGDQATVACFHFSLPRGLELVRRWSTEAKRASLFAVQAAWPHDWDAVTGDAARTGRLIMLDDARGANSLANKLAAQTLLRAPHCRVTLLTREQDLACAVNPDEFLVEAAC